MQRRAILVRVIGVGVAGLTGCLSSGPSVPPTTSPEEPEPATPTQASGLGTIEYTVINEDDQSYSLEVAMTNVEGRVVQETFEPEFDPGETVSSGSAGEPPNSGPYELTFRAGSANATYVWDVSECARIHLQVTITAAGTITVERDVCQN